MKIFLLKSTLFCIPILIFLIPPLLVLTRTGENFKRIEKVIEKNDKYLIGYMYNEENYKYLKWKVLSSQPRKTVIALGSSRVLAFRSIMFDSAFFNAGYTISSISDYVPFLKSIPIGKYPQYLLIGLDQWMFNKNWDSLSIKDRNKPEKWLNSFRIKTEISTIKSVWHDLFIGKYGVFTAASNREATQKIGLNAIINDVGFRNDGSILYGSQVKKLIEKDTTANDFNYSDTYTRIQNGNMRFEYSNEVNLNALKELDTLLNFCKQNKIVVIAFIPPFADKVNEKLSSTNHYSYLKEIYPKSLPYFKKYNFELYDLSSLKYYNSSDNETIDGFHGGEVTYLRMLIKMLENNSVLNNITTIQRLREDLKHPLSNYQVYSY